MIESWPRSKKNAAQVWAGMMKELTGDSKWESWPSNEFVNAEMMKELDVDASSDSSFNLGREGPFK